MRICIYESRDDLGFHAALTGANKILNAIKHKGNASIILATGTSQFEMLKALVSMDIPWEKVDVFHLDEYVGIPISHKASFRKYLKERFVEQVKNVRNFYYINGDAADLKKEIERLSALIGKAEIDVAFIGIGENGHIAFNDPPADFLTESPYIIVNLNEECKMQQVREGWFSSISDVPSQAVSMSVRQIIRSKSIICTVPDERKAEAINMALHAPISAEAPCSILRTHPDYYLMLDQAAASKVISIASSVGGHLIPQQGHSNSPK